jgi:hypothetical protein
MKTTTNKAEMSGTINCGGVTTSADAVRALYEGWRRVDRAAREQFPDLSDEAIGEIVSGAMRHALGMD